MPAFSASQRRSVSTDNTLPTPAWRLDDVVDVGDRLQRLRRIKRFALRELDQHVDRLRAGELCVETIAGGDRLLAIRHLIGEAITRLQFGIDDAESRNDGHATRLKKPGRLAAVRAAIQAQKRRKRSTPVSAARIFTANLLVSR